MTDDPAPLRVLVVDDDDVDREQLRRLLSDGDLSATVAEAPDAESALTLCRGGTFDCVLLDYRLPGVTGLDLFQKLDGEATAVIMLTGLGNETIAVEAMKLGAKDYLLKDKLTTDNLRRAVVNAVDKLRLEQEVREKNRKLEELSLYDPLTGLPNRTLFLDRLDHVLRSAKRADQRFTVFMMDLDLFKEVNDTFGHESGDELLRVVAQRLGTTLRESDTAARIGGDEFCALLPSIDTLEGAAVLAERLHNAISHPVKLDGNNVEVGVSIGIGLFPDQGGDSKSLMHAADMAMYEAKKTGKQFVVSHGALEAQASFEILLPKRLEESLKREEFVLRFQPKLALREGRIVGAEALVRWDHPEFGLLPPMEFIPGAERTALIRPLTLMILEKAVRQAVDWRDSGLDIPVAVNLSPRLLSSSTLGSDIVEILGRVGLSPESLTLEITESGIMTEAAMNNDCLAALAELGVRIAIDDFGTGYTSLRYLSKLPVSEVKIDGVFVKDLQSGSKDASIIRSIVDLANGLDIDVVSEGIESDDAWDELLALGCEYGQGYAIARPMKADEFEEFSADWQGRSGPAEVVLSYSA